MMDRDCCWLSEDQFRRLVPHLPTDTRRKPRVGDHRVINGIVHVLKSGARWVDAPAVYGPRKALYNGFARWAAKGVERDLSLDSLDRRARRDTKARPCLATGSHVHLIPRMSLAASAHCSWPQAAPEL